MKAFDLQSPQRAVQKLLAAAVHLRASDLHLSNAMVPTARVDGSLIPLIQFAPRDERTLAAALEALLTDPADLQHFRQAKELDFRCEVPDLAQFRGNAAIHHGTIKISLRVLPPDVPSLDPLGLPPVLKQMTAYPRGLILVCGPSGSGKSTTLAAMVDHINRQQERVVLTIEDSSEYIHASRRPLVMQREVGSDTHGFAEALRHALRQDPDVIMVGEMRDLETISLGVTAAETGHLVLSTLHTNSAVEAIDRVVDAFPANQRQPLRAQMSLSLSAVIYQVLLPRLGGGRVACCEVLVATPAIRHPIREGKTQEIMTYLQTGRAYGMQTLEQSLAEAKRRGLVSPDQGTDYGKALTIRPEDAVSPAPAEQGKR